MWLCECSCSNKTRLVVSNNHLTRKYTQSCGCLQIERTSKANKKYNNYDLTGEYGIGYTFKDEPFYFDLEDYDRIKEYRWYYSEGYAQAFYNKKRVAMHRIILNATAEERVDHIYHVLHDNRKNQLRLVTISQNCMNQLLHSNNTSGVKGVSWVERDGLWQAGIAAKKHKYSKQFKNKEDAIKWREEKEKELHGEYALKVKEQLNDNSEEKIS